MPGRHKSPWCDFFLLQTAHVPYMVSRVFANMALPDERTGPNSEPQVTLIEAARLAKENDLLQNYNPPCNIQHVI